MDVSVVVEELDARLQTAADPDRARPERAYLKSELTHLGVGVPATRRAVKETLGGHHPVGHDDLIAVVAALWDVTVHERRLAAVEVLTASTDPIVRRWAGDQDFWVRRAASLVHAGAATGRGELGPLLHARRPDARGAGVLRAQGHRLGPA